MRNWLYSLFIVCCGVFSDNLQANAFESNVIKKHYLDYFASHLRMTQQKLNGQDNHITVVGFEGELNKDCFVKGLEMLFQAHPNLRVRKIKYDNIKKLFYFDEELAFSDISCEFIQIEKKDDWRQIVEKQLSHPFPIDGPYWKIYCLSVKDNQLNRHYLIQLFDHSLCDGISTAKLNDEFFTYYNALMNHKEIEVKKYKRIDSLETLEKRCNWQDYKNKLDHFSMLYPMPDKGTPYEKSSSIQQRSTKAILFSFEVDTLYNICKDQGFTVNELLVAVGLSALSKTKSSQHIVNSLDTSVLTCVNLRNPKLNLTEKINSKDLDCFFNIIVHPQKIKTNSTIWTIAENYRKLSTSFINQLALPPIDFLIEEMSERYGLDFATKRNYFAGGIATSNLGRIDLKKKYGNIDIVFYQFFTNQGAGFFEALLDVCTIENTIYGNITYVEPLHSRKWADQFVLNFIQELQSIIPDKVMIVEGEY